MPIYAYRCESCGFEKDVLQKMSDAPLSECPHCQKDTFRKQVTAAGFQLKGSGWYVTDFRGGSNGAGKTAAGGAVAGKSDTASASAGSGASDGGSAAGGASAGSAQTASTADA
jgi:putative FmdB family regulatory protein